MRWRSSVILLFLVSNSLIAPPSKIGRADGQELGKESEEKGEDFNSFIHPSIHPSGQFHFAFREGKRGSVTLGQTGILG